MWDKDSSLRATGSFNGDTWMPDQREILSKSYLQGKTVPVLQMRNDAAYQQYYPMIAGTQWVKPVVLNVVADGNSTRFSAVLCQDDVGPDAIVQVVVNGTIVPRNYSGTNIDPLFRWNWAGDPALGTSYHTGTRRGVAIADVPWNGNDDPSGSLAKIEVVVYSQVAQAGSVPDVRVLLRGPKATIWWPIQSVTNNVVTFPFANTLCAGNPPYVVTVTGCSLAGVNGTWNLSNWTYGPPGTITLSGCSATGSGSGGYVVFKAWTSNPMHWLMEMLIWTQFRYSELDLAAFSAEAQYCDQAVTYTPFAGGSSSHPRFKAQFALEQRITADEAIKALLLCCNGQTRRDPVSGLLQPFIRKTLADQQPSAVPGSNYNTAITSKTAAGVTANGYAAFRFDESNISRPSPDDPPFLRMYSDPSAQVPNRLTASFQDEDNSFSRDSLSVVNPAAVARVGGYLNGEQEIVQSLNILGLSNFDQGHRVMNTFMAERNNGNPFNDERGTLYFEFKTDFRALHLRGGDICVLSWSKYGLSNQLVRVISVAPTTNWEGCQIKVAWHNDSWYTDAFGQIGQVGGGAAVAKDFRMPYPWQPYGAQPISGDSLMGSPSGYASRSWWSFGVAAMDSPAGCNVALFGCRPVTDFSSATQPPIMGILGTFATTGGTIPGASAVYIAIAAVDSAGKLTQLCKPTVVLVASGTNTNTITTPAISWFSGTSGYVVFAGLDSNNMSAQASGSGTPSTITITSLNLETYGPPDAMASRLHFEASLCGAAGSPSESFGHAGVWGDACYSVSTGILHFNPPSGSFTSNQFAGYDLMLVALPVGVSGEIPMACFRITANTAGGDFTVTPDPAAAGIAAGSVFVCMSVPGAGSTVSKIVDTNFQNAYNGGTGLVANKERGNIAVILFGAGKFFERVISGNDATSISWDVPLPVAPDSTTRYIIVRSELAYDVAAPSGSATPVPATVPQVGAIPVVNYSGQTLFIRVHTQDSNGNDSLHAYAPWRIVYNWGLEGGQKKSEVTVTSAMSPYSMDGTIQFVHCDTTAGNVVINVAPASLLALDFYSIDKSTSDAHTVTINAAAGESFPEGASITLSAPNGQPGGVYPFLPRH
jgi:hypothetical protein